MTTPSQEGRPEMRMPRRSGGEHDDYSAAAVVSSPATPTRHPGDEGNPAIDALKASSDRIAAASPATPNGQEGPKPYYDITDGPWRVLATPAGPGEARIVFTRDGAEVKAFDYPAYKVWNISAHMHDFTSEYDATHPSPASLAETREGRAAAAMGRPGEPSPDITLAPEETEASGQAAAKALWESLPLGAEVFVQFMGSGPPRRARRTDIGWESDDDGTRVGCTPWSVRVEDVWIPAAAPPRGALADCDHCGHFQDWSTDRVCTDCGWPDEERMRWRREFDALPPDAPSLPGEQPGGQR